MQVRNVLALSSILHFFWSTVYRQIPTVRPYYVVYLRIYEMMNGVLP